MDFSRKKGPDPDHKSCSTSILMKSIFPSSGLGVSITCWFRPARRPVARCGQVVTGLWVIPGLGQVRSRRRPRAHHRGSELPLARLARAPSAARKEQRSSHLHAARDLLEQHLPCYYWIIIPVELPCQRYRRGRIYHVRTLDSPQGIVFHPMPNADRELSGHDDKRRGNDNNHCQHQGADTLWPDSSVCHAV